MSYALDAGRDEARAGIGELAELLARSAAPKA